MKKLAIAAVLFATLVLTRWTLAPPYLFYFDNINFALSVRDFNIFLHQPQPPGYPFYVVLLKALDLFIPSAKYVQLMAGALGSLAALILLRKLANEMFGNTAGWLAVAILILQPSFWLAGIGDQVRTFLATGSVAVALYIWRARKAGKNYTKWLYGSAAVLGIASGFRPELLVLLFPLLMFPLVEPAIARKNAAGPILRHAAITMAILGLTSSTWFGVIVWKSGGPSGFVNLFLRQWSDTSGHTSVLGGATAVEGLKTLARATYWSGVGALAWMWAVPLVWTKLKLRSTEVRGQLALLAWWWVPTFLFHAIVFVHYPDSTLDASPALALLGAWVLAQLPRPLLAGVAAVAIQAAIFFASPLRSGNDASYAWVKRVGTETAAALDQIRVLPQDRVVAVCNRSLVTGRQIQYYFPRVRVVNVDADLRKGCPHGTELVLPRASYLLWFPPADRSGPEGGEWTNSRARSVETGSRFMAGACSVVVGTGDR